MSESDSQNLSNHSYGGSIEVGSFTVSTYDTEIHAIDTYSGENEGSDRAQNQRRTQTDEADSRPVAKPLTTEAGPSGREKPPPTAHGRDWFAGLPVDSTPPPTASRIRLEDSGLRRHTSLLTRGEIEEVSTLLTGVVKFDTRRSLGNVIDRTTGDWLGMHLDSIKAPLTFPFHPFLLGFMRYYGVLPGQIAPNAYRTLACFSQICTRHGFPATLELFRYLFSVWPLSVKHGGGVLCVQSRENFCKILHLPENN